MKVSAKTLMSKNENLTQENAERLAKRIESANKSVDEPMESKKSFNKTDKNL